MGWFGSSKAEKPNATSREDRSKCWEARDAYFSCLDTAEVVVPGTEGSKCASQRNTYEHNCAKSWVCLSIYSSLHILIFLHRVLNMALRSTTSISVAYWRRSRSRCLRKQRLRLLRQEGHDKGLHHSSLAFEASLPRMCVTSFVLPLLILKAQRDITDRPVFRIHSSYSRHTFLYNISPRNSHPNT